MLQLGITRYQTENCSPQSFEISSLLQEEGFVCLLVGEAHSAKPMWASIRDLMIPDMLDRIPFPNLFLSAEVLLKCNPGAEHGVGYQAMYALGIVLKIAPKPSLFIPSQAR